jgi:hypothetical protein
MSVISKPRPSPLLDLADKLFMATDCGFLSELASAPSDTAKN